ncbi:MAG: hypothetical protein AB1921_08355 [Thermodesulfobacteriota bacterium]
MAEKLDLPVLKCFPVSKKEVQAWCPFCQTWHIHGLTDDLLAKKKSHRTAHCQNPAPSPFAGKGYLLKMVTKKEMKELISGFRLLFPE